MWLRRKESLKYFRRFFGVNTRSGVLYFNADCVAAAMLSSYLQYSTVIVDRIHCVNRVLD